MLADFYAHTFFDDPKAADAVEDEDFSIDEVASIIGANNPDDWEELK